MKTSNLKLQDIPPEKLAKLLTKIESRYIVTDSGCWEWTAGRHSYGYGKISVRGRTWSAHRTYYQLIKGFISDELVISHECDNPPCINPDHLKATTQWENNARGSGVSANNLRKTHCKNGHEFTEENTVIGEDRRSCRTCCNAITHRRDLQRTLEYHTQGLSSKGKPLKRKIDKRFQ